MKITIDQQPISGKTPQQSAGGTKGLWRRLKSVLRLAPVVKSARTEPCSDESVFLNLPPLDSVDVTDTLLPCFDQDGIARECGRSRLQPPEMPVIEMSPSRLLAFQSCPLPRKAVRRLIEASARPGEMFFDIPSRMPRDGQPAREACRVRLVSECQACAFRRCV